MEQNSIEQHEIPDVVVRRLPIYARTLSYLLAEGRRSVSSQELGERINVTAAQIRKDLSWFGEFGKQGIGYDVEKLQGHINRILGLTRVWPVVLVGLGPLGHAIARYEGFRKNGLQIVALFDIDPAKVGTTINNLRVYNDSEMATIVRREDAKLGIVAVPANRAQEVVDRLVSAGVRGILNYAPVIVQVPEGVWVRHIDPVSLLHSITYYLAREMAS
ncbi:MAG TPA: redox-sensing transcriptional repressor Rex [Herpetosiphonaceae bacterium]|nr:redox-sensing transcriptional repressor Rex [Herpetosiphonaceae bacterium]